MVWQQGRLPGVRDASASCPTFWAVGAPSDQGMDRMAGGCQAWVLALLTPSHTLGPTHNMTMFHGPLREEQTKAHRKNVCGGSHGGFIAGNDQEKVCLSTLGQRSGGGGGSVRLIIPGPGAACTGLQEKPKGGHQESPTGDQEVPRKITGL